MDTLLSWVPSWGWDLLLAVPGTAILLYTVGEYLMNGNKKTPPPPSWKSHKTL